MPRAFDRMLNDYTFDLIKRLQNQEEELAILNSVYIKKSESNSQRPEWKYLKAFNFGIGGPNGQLWWNNLKYQFTIARNEPKSKSLQETQEKDRIIINVGEKFQESRKLNRLGIDLLLAFAFFHRQTNDTLLAIKKTKEIFENDDSLNEEKYFKDRSNEIYTYLQNLSMKNGGGKK